MENGLKQKQPELGELLRQFEVAADASTAHRAEAEEARDYYDGKQYTPEEEAILRQRKQPVITDNRVQDKILYMMGLERKTRTDPKAYPRTPADEGSAEAATDGIRYVFDCNDFQQTRSAIFETMMIEGIGAAEVIRDGKKDKIRKIRWDRLYWDQHSMELDFSDAMYLGVVIWMDADKAAKRWPDKAEMIEGAFTDAMRSYVDTYDDKPAFKFIDVKRRRLQVMEHYRWSRDGWKRSVFCQAGFLEDEKLSVYRDEDGVPECPIIAQCAFRDRDGRPYGLVRRYKSLQDEINKRRSKALHMLSSRRVVAEKGAVPDVDKARTEVQRPDGIVEVAPGMRFDVDDNSDIGMAQFQLLVDSINALATTGPNEALKGNSGAISGKAKQLDQEGGAIQIGALFDQIRHFQKRVARATWNRIRQFWTEETWIRVTDDEQKLRFVGFNVPVSAGEQQVEQMKQLGLGPEEMRDAVMQIAMNPMSRVPVARRNDVAQIHVDIIIEESPDTVTLQAEQFAELVNLANAGVIFPPEVYIQASGLRNKEKLVDMIKTGGEQTPEQAQAAQQAQALQQAAAEVELRGKAAKAQKDEADAQKTTVETAVMAADSLEPEVVSSGPQAE